MRIAIDNRIKSAVLISTALWMMGAVVYGLANRISFGSELDWWAFDKLNDRLFNITLLSVASFAFQDIYTRIFCYASMLYVICRAYLEVVYIYYPFKEIDSYWAISAFYCIFVLLSYIVVKYVCSLGKR